jgi:hypothetical protein
MGENRHSSRSKRNFPTGRMGIPQGAKGTSWQGERALPERGEVVAGERDILLGI